jgi:hypothetical protein
MKEKTIDVHTARRLLAHYQTPDHVIRHCMMVARVSSGIAEALNQHGFQLSEELIAGASMVHDIARIHKAHEEVGAALLEEEGYLKEATIVRHHMHHDVSNQLSEIREIDLVCLGDRMVKEDQFVGLEVRMEYILRKWEGHPGAEKIIREKVQNQKQLIREIEAVTGLTIEEILQKKGSETYEFTEADRATPEKD